MEMICFMVQSLLGAIYYWVALLMLTWEPYPSKWVWWARIVWVVFAVLWGAGWRYPDDTAVDDSQPEEGIGGLENIGRW